MMNVSQTNQCNRQKITPVGVIESKIPSESELLNIMHVNIVPASDRNQRSQICLEKLKVTYNNAFVRLAN